MLKTVIEKSSVCADLRLLPLVHTTTFEKAKKIIMSGYLDATPCYAFKDEKLNYFFYSKAEYRHKFGNDSDSNINDLYVTFIFSDNVVSPYRIFPFDTGAWAAGLYNNIFKRDFEIEKDKFQITNNYESLVKYIKIVWGNNENYLNENSLSEFDESNTIPK